MAESSVHDVVNEPLSAGAPALSDAIASNSDLSAAGDGQAQNSSTPEIPATTNDDRPVESAKREEDVDDGPETGPKLSKSEDEEAGTNEGGGSATADGSVGSDTDTNNADARSVDKDSNGHARTASVKKPASFKPVSVTKSFLQKSVTASPVVRPGDKVAASASPASALQNAAKPRLVAKSALGGMSARLTKPNGTGPEAGTVWNKNRPVPVPPPKQFTDEELQTRYGIHMATRLQSDEATKDNKWADIDDDEDDWAPETVEWMDGTKSSVPTATDQQQAPVQRLTPSPSEQAAPEPAKPGLATQTPATPIATPTATLTPTPNTRTILKPGAQLNLLPKTGGSSPKSQGASLAKGESVPPTKSPWAKLPPVEKIAPINPPIQPLRRPFQRDPSGFDSLPPAPSPAVEIAADDFNRSLGDGRGTRELFNAQSGRYEPAGDARRGSRHEPGYRQPAVLQRPMHNGPAEPSASFQTSRSSLDGPSTWSRRRASSNLSGVGGRRLSIAYPSEDAPAVNGSAIESPVLTPAALHPPSWSQSTGPPPQPSVPDSVPPPDPEVQLVEAVEMQKRTMKEKIENARLQKQLRMEQEKAEEAARQERLKAKLAALAPSSEPTQEKETPKVPAAKPAAMSPPKPPIPTHDGEVAQYGVMKVHQAHPVRKNHAGAESQAISRPPRIASMPSRTQESGSPEQAASRTNASSQPHSTAPAAPNTQKRVSDTAPAGPIEQLGQSTWKPPTPQDYNWGTASTMNARSAVVGGSVWGPPSSVSDRSLSSLGNGTFDTSKFSSFENRGAGGLNRFQENNGNNSRSSAHGPIGSAIKSTTPPRHSHFAQTFQNLEKQQDRLPQPSASDASDEHAFALTAHLDSSLRQSIEQSLNLHPLASSTSSHLPQLPQSQTNMSAPAIQQPQAAPQAIGAHARAAQWLVNSANKTPAEWAKFYEEDHKARAAAYEERLRKSRELEEKTVKYNIYVDLGAYIDHYQIAIQPDGRKVRSLVTGAAAATDVHRALAAKSKTEHPEDHAEVLAGRKLPPPSLPGQSCLPPHLRRGPNSKFQKLMPGAGKDENANSTSPSVPGSDLPPPAEEGLFEPDNAAPIKVKVPNIVKVRLPGSGSAPNAVALPPRSPNLDASFSAPPTQPKGFAKPAAHLRVEDLRSRFTKQPQGTAVRADTKPSWDVALATAKPNGTRAPPTVAVTNASSFASETFCPTSKPSADEELFDPPEFASKPTVRILALPHQNHQYGYSHESQFHQGLALHDRFTQQVDVLSVIVSNESLFPAPRGLKFGTKVTIGLPNKAKKYVDVRLKASGTGHGGPRKHNSHAGASARGKPSPTRHSYIGNGAGLSQRHNNANMATPSRANPAIGAASGGRNPTKFSRVPSGPKQPRGWNAKPGAAAPAATTA